MPLISALFWTSWSLILYTYVVFPTLLAVAARLRAPRKAEPLEESDLPRVAMVVAAYNESLVLAEKLENFLAIDYPEHLLSLYIGSDGSDDGTAELLASKRFDRIHPLLFTERRGKISTLNDIVPQCTEPILVFSDANSMYAPDAVRKLVAPFTDKRIGCVSGQLSLDNKGGVSGEGIYWKYENWIKSNESGLGFLIGCNGGIFAIRRELYEPLPTSTIVEDFVLTLRILERGKQVVWVRDAVATEPPAASTSAEMTRKIRIGAGGFQALSLNRALLSPFRGMPAFAFWGHKVLRWFVPHFYLAAMIANIALATARPGYAIWGLLQIAGISMALAGSRMEKQQRTPPKWMRPVAYFYIMNYALWIGFLRHLRGSQPVTWEKAASMPNLESENYQE